MNNELMEKIKAAKSAEEILEIARKELSFEDTANVAGGTGRFELTETQAEHVAGGGHYYTDSTGHRLWISLFDDGYVMGTDPWFDKAYILESMAYAGHSVDLIIDFACELFPSGEYDTKKAMRVGGPAYLAACVKGADGYHFKPE